jgi:predicted anti-sigma-YlaC factor YlaD
MNHFDRQEWLKLHHNEINNEQRMWMEQHLTACDDCRQAFLDCIDQAALDQASNILPPDFTSRTLTYIEQQTGVVKSHTDKTKKKTGKKRLLSYYVSAAAITLVLMSCGVFQSAALQAANMPASIAFNTSVQPKSNFSNWTAQLREKTSNWINAIYKEVK